VYVFVAVSSGFNIGHRHLVPVYPLLFVLGGASAAWLARRAGRWLVAVALVWLIGANLWIHPHYLSYFNELIGGPRRGHLYLADSNIDWGQDLKRLAHYARAHPDESIKLAYFGSALPASYGFASETLPSYMPFPHEPAALTAGTYVVSLTQLLGIYEARAAAEYWTDPKNVRRYAAYIDLAATPDAPGDPADVREARRRARRQVELLRPRRLLNRLRERPADERIGYSLFVYRLEQAEIDAMLRP
jgi:hypothetical protein